MSLAFKISLLVLALIGAKSSLLAAVTEPTKGVPSIAGLRAGNFGKTPALSLVSFYAGGSSGGGTLKFQPKDMQTPDNS